MVEDGENVFFALKNSSLNRITEFEDSFEFLAVFSNELTFKLQTFFVDFSDELRIFWFSDIVGENDSRVVTLSTYISFDGSTALELKR